MSVVETKFINDRNIEAQRLLNVYWSLAHGIYSSHGFYVLPYRVAGNPKVIYLPEIEGVDSKKIVETLSQYDQINVPSTDKSLLEYAGKIEKGMGKKDEINLEKTKEVEANWLKIQEIFENYITNLFPSLKNSHLSLNIYWTRYGSLMSYNRPVVKGVSCQGTIFLRDDMGIPQIIEGFLSSVLSQLFVKRQMSWIQKESIVDFLALDTGISNFAEGYIPTVLSDESNTIIDSKTVSDSAKYLKKMGLGKQTFMECKNGLLYIHGLPSKTNFGPLEVKFLQILIENTNNPVSYFDISDYIWPENEDAFSLWALSQLAYKIKNKLRKCSINPEVIRNVRGIGYIYTPQN
jgi:hypothetical protein